MGKELLLVGAGGAVGAVLRYLVAQAMGGTGAAAGGFPVATLVVNVAGSLALGAIAGLLSRGSLDPAMRELIAVGLLGALTTFSTFGLETAQLLQSGHPGRAALSVALNVTLAITAAWCGLRLTTPE